MTLYLCDFPKVVCEWDECNICTVYVWKLQYTLNKRLKIWSFFYCYSNVTWYLSKNCVRTKLTNETQVQTLLTKEGFRNTQLIKKPTKNTQTEQKKNSLRVSVSMVKFSGFTSVHFDKHSTKKVVSCTSLQEKST